LKSAAEKKDLALGYALWSLSLMGICGVQRMYLGQPGLGIALLFTFGFCGVGQIMDLILLPDAVKQANLRLGPSGSELAAKIPTFPQSQPSVRTQSPQASSASLRSADDDEFDQLLSQAEKSVSRTQSYLGDDDGR
jgi:TM2 domain-containing membrane protein YozV